MKKYLIEVTEGELEKHGLIKCQCGHASNNHFINDDNKPCAHCDCKGYKSTILIGKLSLPVEAQVKPANGGQRTETKFLDVIKIKPELINHLDSKVWLQIKDDIYILMGNWILEIPRIGELLYNITEDSRLSV